MRTLQIRTGACALAVTVCASLAAAQTLEQPLGPTDRPNPQLPQPLEATLTFEEANALAEHPRWLSLKYGEFDTSGEAPTTPEDLTAKRDESGYFLAQFLGPISDVLRLRTAETGVELLDYIPNYAFIVRGTAAQRAALEDLVETVWTGEFHPAYRLDARLRLASEDENYDATKLRVVVTAFEGVELATLEAQLAPFGLRAVESDNGVGRWVVVVEGTAKQARALARARDVQWIEPEGVFTTRNNTMSWTVQTFVNLDREIWNAGIRGQGQVIGHIDGSIALSSCYFSDPSGAPIGPTHRKVVFNNGSGTDTHGTHTAGTSAGDAQPVNGSTSNRGLAYLAKIAHTTGAPFSTFASVASTHAANGARTHTNSWGDDGTTAYNTICNQIDSFQWNNEDNLILFAETNTSSLRNPENAKNLVAVGASQNGSSANSFCSGGTGPTADGRRKPEVFAPGCSIVSAGTGGCSTNSLTGTSMACPAATGAAALIREYFMDGFYPSGAANASDAMTPTGALVKAVLINTCQNMSGISGYPSNQEGWGRINLDESLHLTGEQSKLFVVDVRRANGLTTGQSETHHVTVTSNAVPLEITLAFHDATGTVNASNPVINNLDLVVTSPSSVVYRGNVFSSSWSTAGGSADAKNNVERVALQTPEVGAWTIEILATNVPQSAQGYGLCVTGDVTAGAGSGSSNPTNYCTPGLTSNFCIPTMSSAGVANVGASNGFTLIANNVEGARQGILFYGVNGRNSAVWFQNNSSFLCVKAPVQRMGTQNSGGTNGLCDGTLSTDWSAYVSSNPGALGAPFTAGQIINAQAWFRDPPAAGTTNLTDGIEFTVQP